MRDSAMSALSPVETSRALDEVTAPWYGASKSAVVSFRVDMLLSAIDLVEIERVRNARDVLELYLSQGLQPFVPVASHDGVEHLGVLVEQSLDGLLILDGTHRAFAARSAKISHIWGTLISPSPALPAPVPLIPLAGLREVEDGGKPKFSGQNVHLFRPASRWLAQWRQIR